jgi:hypothetical protein
MARDVNARYRSMEDLIAALEPFAGASRSGTAWQASSRSRVSLEETQADPLPELPQQYAPPSSVATKPQLASTPFASELSSGSQTRGVDNRTVYAVASFCAAAALLVGGIWYFTREPAAEPPMAAPAFPAQAEDTQNAATAQPASEVVPRGVAPVDPAPVLPAPVTPVTPTTLGAPVAPTMRGATRDEERGLTAPNRHTEAQRDGRRETASRHNATGRTGGLRLSDDVRHTSPPPPVVMPPSAAEPIVPRGEDKIAPATSHRARSGALNVNEF